MGWFDWVLLGLQLLWALLFVLIWFWSEEVGLAVDAGERHVHSLEAQIHKLRLELEALQDRSELSERTPVEKPQCTHDYPRNPSLQRSKGRGAGQATKTRSASPLRQIKIQTLARQPVGRAVFGASRSRLCCGHAR